MTKEQANIVIAFAKNDMQIKSTADELYMSEGNVTYHLKKIKNQMGWNPRKFFDLCFLVGIAAKMNGGYAAECNTNCAANCGTKCNTGEW